MRLGESVAQPEHAGPALPGVDQRSVLRFVEREVAEDRKAVRIFGRCLFGDLSRVRVPARRVQQTGIDLGGIHVADALLSAIRGYLAMRRIGRRSGRPDVNLRVDYQHGVPPTGARSRRSCYAMSSGLEQRVARPLLPERNASWCGDPALRPVLRRRWAKPNPARPVARTANDAGSKTGSVGRAMS